MSEITQNEPLAPVANVSEPDALASAPIVDADASSPAWLPQRLEQARSAERSKFLAGLGYTDGKALQADLSALKASRDAQLSDAQRSAATIAELEPRARRVESLEIALQAYASTRLDELSAAQRAAVGAIAGADPVLQLSAISALAPTWTPIEAPAPAARVVSPISTSSAPVGPGPADTPSLTDHKARYAYLERTNPFAAASYFAEHRKHI